VKGKFSKRVAWLREIADKDLKAAEVLSFVGDRFLSLRRYFSFLAGSVSLYMVMIWYGFGGLATIVAPKFFPWLTPFLPVV